MKEKINMKKNNRKNKNRDYLYNKKVFKEVSYQYDDDYIFNKIEKKGKIAIMS